MLEVQSSQPWFTNRMDLTIVPLHKYPEYTLQCCQLINDQWKRSETARLRSLQSSCDTLPTSLILLEKNIVIGHLKLSAIPSIKDACFLESVVIDRKLRGKGYGKMLMKTAEEHCRNILHLNTIYLSTKGQEPFYSKLGYVECRPVSIYGNCTPRADMEILQSARKNVIMNRNEGPPPPPLPSNLVKSGNAKTFMKKSL